MRRLLTFLFVAAVLGGAVVSHAAVTGTIKHCGHIRGYYSVTIRNTTCSRAGHILWHARGGQSRVEGWRCVTAGVGPGGGFPAYSTCVKGRARAHGWVIDGPA
jgi:ribosomal protein S27E